MWNTNTNIAVVATHSVCIWWWFYQNHGTYAQRTHKYRNSTWCVERSRICCCCSLRWWLLLCLMLARMRNLCDQRTSDDWTASSALARIFEQNFDRMYLLDIYVNLSARWPSVVDAALYIRDNIKAALYTFNVFSIVPWLQSGRHKTTRTTWGEIYDLKPPQQHHIAIANEIWRIWYGYSNQPERIIF